MKKTKSLYIICIFVSIMSLMACTGETQPAEQEHAHDVNAATMIISKQQFEAGGMQLVKLKKQAFNETVYCTGTIDVPPQNRAVISAVMGGYVKNSTLLVGDHVRRGQLLLRLENPAYAELQQQFLETKAKLAYLKEDFERQSTLNQEKIASKKEYLQAKSNYESATARLKGLGEQLKMLSINPEGVTAENISATIELHAPIEGTISMVNISRGTYVAPSVPLMEIIDLNHLHLELNVYEQDFIKVKKDQVIQFTVPEAGDTKYVGEVHLIGNTIEAATRTVKVHGHLENDSNSFAVGMFIEAEIVTEADERYALPEEAVVKSEVSSVIIQLVSSDKDSYVFKLIDVETSDAVNGFKALPMNSEIDTTASYLVGGFHFIDQGEGGHKH